MKKYIEFSVKVGTVDEAVDLDKLREAMLNVEIDFNAGEYRMHVDELRVVESTARVASSIEWTGKNWNKVYPFIHAKDGNMKHHALSPENVLRVDTLSGATMMASIGQHIVKDEEGRFSVSDDGVTCEANETGA